MSVRLIVLLALFLTATALLPSHASASDVYAIYGPRGSVTFTSRTPPPGAHYRIIKSNKRSGRASYSKVSRVGTVRAVKSKYDSLISDMAGAFSVDSALVKAVVHAESSFNPQARSHKGAMGLMQLMPATAKRFGVGDAYHVAENVRAGVTYLKFLLERYQGNERLAVAAYNAGEGAVDKYSGIPPYPETIAYVSKVMRLRELYR